MRAAGFVRAAEQFADSCRAVDLPADAELLEQMLRTSEIVRYELDGLADRIRAAQKVNGTPRPGPVKPMPQRQQPKTEPPKNDPPPQQPGKGGR